MQKTNTENTEPAQTDVLPQPAILDTSRPNRGVFKRLAIGAGAVVALSGGAYVGDTIRESSERIDQLEQEVDDTNRSIVDLENENNALEDASREKIEFLEDVAGIDQQVFMEHANRSPIPEVEFFPSDVAEKQDRATLHLLAYRQDDTGVIDDDAVSGHACNVFKNGDSTVSTAAHCMTDVYSELYAQQGKRGGDGGLPEKWVSSGVEYFVSNDANISFAQAQKSAMRVVSYGSNNYYLDGDGVLLGLEPAGDDANSWFSEIEVLKNRESRPDKGQHVRVSGHTTVNGVLERVSSTGVVLGEVSPDNFGFTYFGNLTIVGINLDSEENDSFACNFGESGSALVTETEEAFGALAYVGQSASPEDANQPSIVTPDTSKAFELEELLDVKLLGENYVLCGYSPTYNLVLSPLEVAPNFASGGK